MSNIRVFTVDELIAELSSVARDSPLGGKTRVCIGDWEGNMGAFGLIQTLQVVYDAEISRIMIMCDPHER